MFFCVIINMKHIISTIFAIVFAITVHADVIGQWRLYQSYCNITEVCTQSPDELYWVLASDHLYQYSVSDSTSYIYSREHGLSDHAIAHIAWNGASESLLIAYRNCNLDILRSDGSQVNIMDYMNKSVVGMKDVTGIVTQGSLFYVKTSEQGIIEVNPSLGSISDYLVPGTIRYNQINAIPLPELVIPDCLKNFVPVGPMHDDIYNSAIAGDRLITVRGGYDCSHYYKTQMYYSKNSPGLVQKYDISSDKWSIFDNSFASKLPNYRGNNVIAVDPLDDGHIAVGGRDGLFIFKDDTLVVAYNNNNSPLVFQNDLKGAIVTGLTFDNKGNLFVANSLVTGAQLYCLDCNGQWKACYGVQKRGLTEEYQFCRGLKSLTFDNDNNLWFVNDDFRASDGTFRTAIFCYSPDKDDVVYLNISVNNQNNTIIDNELINRCLLQTHDGNIWVGTSAGPVYITPSQVARQDMTLHQHIVPRNDGTGLGDYLLSGVDIYCMAEDKKGRLWIGTKDNGVYLISADRNTEEAHFTTQNSILPDNCVNSISIQQETGLVFFCTEYGIASYQSDATQGAEDVEGLYCYPNPVRPEYSGNLTISGLIDGASVTITDALNNPIFRDTAIGGTMTWDMRTPGGSRVSPGIYFVYQVSGTSKGKMFKVLIL